MMNVSRRMHLGNVYVTNISIWKETPVSAPYNSQYSPFFARGTENFAISGFTAT